MEKKALALAKKYHKGQKRNSGRPSITHPIRVANSVSKKTKDKRLIATAYLHDIIEDTKKYHPEKLGELRREIKSIDKKVLEYVEQLTRNKKIKYETYIKKIARHNKVLIVKFHDLMDNITDNPTNKQKEKYKNALSIIVDELKKSK